ncbi:MAG: hypothetical protein AAGB51_05530 [Planctomycetota bacterium]
MKRRFLIGFRLGIASVVLSGISACSGGGDGTRSASDIEQQRETGRALFEEPTGPAIDYDWTVVIATFAGPQHAEFAEQGRDKVLSETRLRDIRIQQRGPSQSAVVLGRFTTPGDPDAQRSLRRVRETEVGGGTPFAGAFLAPPPPPTLDQLGPFDLRRAAATRPDAMYTLQIGIYQSPDRSRIPTSDERRELHAAAERAVRQLRGEGAEAFYQHTPNGSNVTVGLFRADEHRAVPNRPSVESDRIRSMRQRYPNLLLNGQGQRRIVRTPTGQALERPLEPSVLVEVPR